MGQLFQTQMFVKCVVHFLLFVSMVHLSIETSTPLKPYYHLEDENVDDNIFINADMTGVVWLSRGYSAPCGEVTKAVASLL